ncbi:MAG: type II secretion system major pseudopilin GspG [Candidatus Omnitrophica bacterium]|nr:type II secretion system major pseudopilin GspG [Candidatus Omnitrophota bacterium]
MRQIRSPRVRPQIRQHSRGWSGFRQPFPLSTFHFPPHQLLAFTLIELMLVIVIISALAAMVVPRLVGRSEEAKRGVAEADIKGNLSLALKLYEVDNGRYPSSEQGLNALREKPTSPPSPRNWKGPYLEQEALDPWKKPYVYQCPGSHPPHDYDLSSMGPDGVESDDDIVNWK